MPIDAFIFGGRRSTTVPLVTEARDWIEGVYMAATMGSRDHRRRGRRAGRGAARPVRDAAVLRLQHERLLRALARRSARRSQRSGAKLPKIYCVNWFRKGADGKFVWPGYGENMRVLDWIARARRRRRRAGEANAFGTSPRYDDLDWQRPRLRRASFEQVTDIDVAAWRDELALHDELFKQLARPPARRAAATMRAHRRRGCGLTARSFGAATSRRRRRARRSPLRRAT